MKYKIFFIISLCMLSILSFTACKDGNGEAPVITGVRITDPEAADSLFSEAERGKMIVIIGNNLEDPKELYINDQKVSFNPNYSTSHDLIVTIPEKLVLVGEDSTLTSRIRLVTANGEVTYNFHVNAPAATISYVEVNKYPVKGGDTIIIHGTNFMEVKNIYFTESDTTKETAAQPSANDVNITNYSVDKEFSTITAVVPENSFKEGYLAVNCYTNVAYTAFRTTLPPPEAYKLSSDMPEVGSQVFIVGKNFIRINNVDINGEFTVDAKDLTISTSLDTIFFTLPKMPTKSGQITINGEGGTCTAPDLFYPFDHTLVNYDDVGWFSWGTCKAGLTADGVTAPFTANGKFCGIVGKAAAWNYWWQQIISGIVYPSTDIIPGETPTSNIELRFECYTVYPIKQISANVEFGGVWNDGKSGYRPVDINTSEQVLGRWFTCSIPMSSLTKQTTYSKIKTLGAEVGFSFINGTGVAEDAAIYFDNFRLYVKK
jgi:hypothetical protein